MTLIPNGRRAFIDPIKLTGYVLDPAHRTGRHKARVFAAALGLSREHASVLGEALLSAAETADAVLEHQNRHGAHYAIEFIMTHGERSASVRSLWTIRSGEDFPRFVTAFVK
jgi:hypothetical protein